MAPGKWGIDKRDGRGRTVDVHALRHTFGTLLSKGGKPRTAQAASFQDRPDDERLHRSEALGRGRGRGIAPFAPSGGWFATGSCRRKGNGDRGFNGSPVCIKVCTNYRQTEHAGGNSGRSDRHKGGTRRRRGHRRKCLSGQKKRPADNYCQRVLQARATGLEPATTGSTGRQRGGRWMSSGRPLSQLARAPGTAYPEIRTDCSGQRRSRERVEHGRRHTARDRTWLSHGVSRGQEPGCRVTRQQKDARGERTPFAVRGRRRRE